MTLPREVFCTFSRWIIFPNVGFCSTMPYMRAYQREVAGGDNAIRYTNPVPRQLAHPDSGAVLSAPIARWWCSTSAHSCWRASAADHATAGTATTMNFLGHEPRFHPRVLVTAITGGYVLIRNPLMVDEMTETSRSTITKAELDRFFLSKHVTGCAVCGRFQPLGEVDERVVNCQPISSADALSGPMTVLVIACKNCGAIQLYDQGVIAEWLQCHRDVHCK